MHSPPRAVSVREQQDWKIPPCISNWKNAKGYTIPLDKRLAADGRGLQETAINDNFAKFTEALYVAESNARQVRPFYHSYSSAKLGRVLSPTSPSGRVHQLSLQCRQIPSISPRCGPVADAGRAVQAAWSLMMGPCRVRCSTTLRRALHCVLDSSKPTSTRITTG